MMPLRGSTQLCGRTEQYRRRFRAGAAPAECKGLIEGEGDDVWRVATITDRGKHFYTANEGEGCLIGEDEVDAGGGAESIGVFQPERPVKGAVNEGRLDVNPRSARAQ